MMIRIRSNPGRRQWPLLTMTMMVVSSLLVPSTSAAVYLRRPQRSLQQADTMTTTEYSVLLHLALEYANDTLADQFDSATSDAVRHFCNAVNQQVRRIM